ncbi:MAG: hypothetical protein J0L57_20630, partial [Burkholderiales bacterium]|nr:hypothetical protein [Burkholderiales bacterium]
MSEPLRDGRTRRLPAYGRRRTGGIGGRHIGLIFWGLSGGSVWIIGIVPQLNFSIDRFMLPFMLGASL